MPRTVVYSLCWLLGASGMLVAQTAERLPGMPDTTPFRPLELPSPNSYRTGAGTPGPLYWQQRADYSIRASLDTATHTVAGEETIRYTNNSPDPLRFVWLNLEQNLRSQHNPYALMGRQFDDAEPGLGFIIRQVGAREPARASTSAAFTPLRYRISGTLMHVTLDAPLSPRGTIEIRVAWDFRAPPQFWGASRKRYQEGWLYQIGQWYPRMVVYDDVHGWNTEQYLGRGEFYLEYGDFDYAITAPASYTVVGTGVLVNESEVLNAEQRRRLAVALRSDTIVHVITREEVTQRSAVPPRAGTLRTWRFRAQNVRDVAWAAAPNFLWDAVGADGILIQALYPPTVPQYWDQAVEMARHTIRLFSNLLLPYPYPTATIVGGPSGMEYPMLSFVSEAASGPTDCPKCGVGPQGPLFEHLAHELSHQWLPMIVGSNERLHGWQDEGLTMLLGLRHWRERFPDDTAYRSANYVTADGQFSATGWTEWLEEFTGSEGTVMVSQDRGVNQGVGYMHYIKVPIGLRFLRHEVVDSTAFDEALREYVRRWAFKHPTPADFFRTMDDVLGEDLSWFWRSWFYRSDHLDLAIDSVVQRDSADVTISSIHVSHRAEMVAPIELRITGADGSALSVKLPVQVWYGGSRYVHRLVATRAARPVVVEVDPRRVYPDVDRTNNRWRTAP